MTAAILSAKRWLAADGDAGRRGQRALGFLVAGAGLVAMSGEALAAFHRRLASNPALLPALVATAATAAAPVAEGRVLDALFRRRRDAVRGKPRCIPEPHRKGHEQHATLGLIAGLVLMMSLDTALA